ncbi:MAG: hypothetical protein AAF961_18480 [Planctomycetota bacterium]
MAHRNRKKSFVDPQVQGALIRRLICHWLAFIGVAAVVAFFLQILSDPFRPISAHLQNLWWTHGPFLLVMAFMLPVFVVDTIKLSHRFAGPIYRLRQTIRTIAQGGDFKPLRFRDFDFWQGMAQDFNKMVERLSSRTDERAELQESDDSAAQPSQV